MQFSDLVGKTLAKIKGGVGDGELDLIAESGERYRMSHGQDCCEHVRIEEIVGDLKDLIGSPILQAEEESNADDPEPLDAPTYDDYHTWTFYKLATIKGSVTIRWLGESNGYYSESVDFEQVK